MTGEATVLKSENVPITESSHVVLVRQRVRALAVELAFTLVDQTKIVTAASELGRNTLEYGLGGFVELTVLQLGTRHGIRMSFQDQGPGIPDIGLAMQDGYTSGKGMGLGLSGSKRLMNEFKIDSELGKGTTVTVTRWKA